MVFIQEMIIPIMHVDNWRYMCQRKKVKIDRDRIHEISTIIDQDYRVGDQVLVIKKPLNMKQRFEVSTKFLKRG